MQRTLQVFNFSVQNAANDAVDIHIDGDIVDASTQQIMKDWWGDDTSVSFRSFRNQINDSGANTFNVYINSGGGHVGDAMAIHDLLVDLQSKGKTVNTKGVGIVASAATYILMAGKNSEMSKNSWFMIHNASGGIYGDVNVIENYARTLRKFNDSVRDFYATATGKSKDAITKMMDNETWMTAEDAKNDGFVKQISGEASFKNAIPKENWQYSNTAVLNAYNSAVKVPQQQDDHKTYIDNKIDEMKNFFSDIINSIKGVKPAADATPEQIVNAIAEGIAPHFQEIHTEIEAEVTNRVDAAVKGEAFTNAVNAAVTAQMVAVNQKLADLEADVVNKLGQPVAPTAPANSSTEQPIGKYVNEN